MHQSLLGNESRGVFPCFSFPCGKETSDALKDQSAESVVGRLLQLQRAQKMKAAGLLNDQREEELDAVRAARDKDAVGARVHVRLMLMHRQNRERLLQKYENLVHISSRIQSSLDNVSMSRAMSRANMTLETLLASAPDYDDLMDELRQSVCRVDDDSLILGESIAAPQEHLVEQELETLFNDKMERDAEEVTAQLPNVPSVHEVDGKKILLKE